MSSYPNDSANYPEWDDEWQESEKVCPECKDVLMWQAGWYDDSEESGGACIGTQYECGNCGYHDSQ